MSESQCKFIFDVLCTNHEINNLIKEDQATFAVHIECKYTFFRELIYLKDIHHEYVIDGSKVERAIEVCPFIVATIDIDH